MICSRTSVPLRLLFSAASLTAAPAIAADFIVDDASTETNGGNTIDGDDSLTIADTGSITVTGDGVSGVSGTGQNNSVVNEGAVSSNGNQAYGIRMQNGQNTVNNTGTVVTAGTESNGVWTSGGSNSVTNSGSIGTLAADSNGVNATGGGNTVSSSGTVSTAGAGSIGIRASAGGNSVANGGTIETIGDSAHGIRATGGGNTVTTGGIIRTSGAGAHGVFDSTGGDSITNSGTITTSGSGSYGIRTADGNNGIVNSGAITTAGTTSYGVRASAGGNSILNTGSIVTSGSGGDAINASGGNNTVTNSSANSITTSGDGAAGVRASGGGSTITNSGAISTAGSQSYGIRASGGGNTIVNSGSIHTTGTGADGILATAADNTVTVSGTVISEQGNSVNLDGDNAVLMLMPGARLQGNIVFDNATSGTLRLSPGLSTFLTLDGVPATIDGNGAPVVTSGAVVASVDTTGFAAADAAFNDLTRATADALDARMAGNRLGAGTQIFAMGRDGADGGKHRRGWATLIGGFRDQDATDTTASYENLLGGVIGGMDRPVTDSRSFGLYGGYAYHRLRASGDSTTTDVNTLFGGTYASYRGDSYFLDATGTVGVGIYDNDRQVINTGVSGGVETARADYNGYFLSPSLTIGTDTQILGRAVTPSVRLRYAALFLDSYTESGSSANLSVGSRTAHFGEVRGQLAVYAKEAQTGQGAMNAVLRVGVDGIFNWGDDVDATLLGQGIRFAPGDQDAAVRGFVGADVAFSPHGGNLFVTAGFEAGYDTNDAFSGEARIGITKRF